MEQGDSKVEVVILGSGTSHGVPMIGCDCPVCTSTDPRDRRSRPSICVRMGRQRILVDATPELRLQCIANGVDRLDAVLFTHHHADHVAGLDDLRRFNWLSRRALPCYATARTLASLKQMFSYAFQRRDDYPSSKPELLLQAIDTAPFTIGGQTVVPIPLMHGPLPVRGFRFGRFAYCTDCSHIPDSSIELLDDLDVLVLEAVRRAPHPTHFNLEQAVEMAKVIGAKRTFFTHIAHKLKHVQTNAELPETMALAYDGMRIVVS